MSMQSRMSWTRWAREQAVAHELSERQAHALLVLATIGNQAGEGFTTRGDLAAFLRCSETHASRLVRQLRDRGLVVREGPENGRLRWRLSNARQPAAQLTLDDGERDGQRSHPTTASEAPMSHPVGHLEVTPVEPLEVTQKDNRAHKDQGQGTGGRASDQDQVDWGALEASLRPVLRVLEEAPGLDVVDAAVNSALAAHPEPRFDHLRAAHTVAAWAHEGGLGNGMASLLLNRAFDRQDRSRRPASNGRRPSGDDPEATARLRQMRIAMARARGEEVEAS